MNFMDAIPGLTVLDEAGIKKLYFTALEILERTGENEELAKIIKNREQNTG